MDSSLGSLSSPRRSKATLGISRTFKHARDLFLQRRLPEAFSTILPLITEPSTELKSEELDGQPKTVAPVASASRSSRVKVWSLYITLLNAIAELGPEDGKDLFGNKEWRSIVAKAQDGTVWDDVVNIGYHGVEGSVDADVVANLANLLLAQSSSQMSTQRNLESYLSTYSQLHLDQFATQINLKQHANSIPTHRNGTNTPRDLESKIQIVELYTLHVLPRNGEWEYAKEFINMSEVLDEERREAFLETLKSFEDQEKGTTPLQEIEPMQEPEKVQDTPVLDSISSDSASTVRESERPSSTGLDYGIEKRNSSVRPEVPIAKATPLLPKPIRKLSNNNYPSRPSRPPGSTNPPKSAQINVYKRSVALIANLHQVFSNMSHHLSQNPMALLRFVLFLAGLVAALSKRDVKDRLAVGWDKIRRTVGMGVKVSYI